MKLWCPRSLDTIWFLFWWLVFCLWIIQTTSCLIFCDYTIQKMFILISHSDTVSFQCPDRDFWNNVLANPMHFQIIVKNTVRTSNQYPNIWCYFLKRFSSVPSNNPFSTLDGFVICRSRHTPTVNIIINTNMTLTETLVPLIYLCFLMFLIADSACAFLIITVSDSDFWSNYLYTVELQTFLTVMISHAH